MNEALRGSRLGAVSYETDDHVELAPREVVPYDCPDGHSFVVPLSVEAEVPPTWECRVCGKVALRRDGEQPDEKSGKKPRTHWDMLLERRSIEDLESLLTERLSLLRDRGGPNRVTPTDHRRTERKSA